MAITKLTRFLVVDDYQTMRNVTKGLLKSFGVEKVSVAANGREGLEILKYHPIDVVLSDWNMPVMTGLELLKAVRADAKLRHLPFLMITAEAEYHRVAEAVACGVSDILVKPYKADRLKERILKAMSQKPRTPSAVSAAVASSPSVPVSNDRSAAGPAPAGKERDRPTILVVDDTPDNLQLLSGLFKDEYRVRIANSGEKALEICTSENAPDLVLLDIMMPGMDGFEVAKRMREHPNSEHIPVIFVTAMTGDDARLKGLELGAVDFVTKPINPNVLIPRVRNFMRYVELHKQLQYDYDAMLDNARLREDIEHITRHDLKGPLGGLIGLAQSLAEDDSFSNKQTEQLRILEETGLQVINMINLSSELYKIETGRFQLNAQPVKINEMLRRIMTLSRNAFSDKHLDLSMQTDTKAIESPPQALGDAMLCYSLFQNLIKNACEAAPQESSINISLVNGNPLKVVIQNKGAVPVAIRERFFDKFATSGKTGGTGLGTYSAKLLTEAQNGSISLEVSDEKNLTTVTVSLPKF
jgi:hypothetical protein